MQVENRPNRSEVGDESGESITAECPHPLTKAARCLNVFVPLFIRFHKTTTSLGPIHRSHLIFRFLLNNFIPPKSKRLPNNYNGRVLN